MLAGFLPGAIISGVQLAVSAANTGGAWDNAKKYIESGAMIDENGNKIKKGSEVHKAAVVGDTVGDPLKDTSGPALNILMKLMAIISLVFGSKFAAIHTIVQVATVTTTNTIKNAVGVTPDAPTDGAS
jgi:Na+/H+-translocating membrane pyrophosphatase